MLLHWHWSFQDRDYWSIDIRLAFFISPPCVLCNLHQHHSVVPKVLTLNVCLLLCRGIWSAGESCLHHWDRPPHTADDSPSTLCAMAIMCNIRSLFELHCLNCGYWILEVVVYSIPHVPIRFHAWSCAQHANNCMMHSFKFCGQSIPWRATYIVHCVQSVNVRTKYYCVFDVACRELV